MIGRGEFISNHPYDIYSKDRDSSTPLMSLLENPAVWGGSLAADLLVAPKLTNPDALRAIMGRSTSSAIFKETYRHYGTGLKPRVARSMTGRYLTTASDSALGFKPTSGSYMAQQRGFAEHLQSKIGTRAATRVQWARGIHGVSRFIGAYFMAHLGISAIKGLADMITDYVPPDPKTPRSRDIETGGMYVDTRAAQTQRARAMQAIHNTQLSTRAALSNEASFMHFNR